MSVLSNGKLYEGNERPPDGEPDILLPKTLCRRCGRWYTDMLLHIWRGCDYLKGEKKTKFEQDDEEEKRKQ
jgi:hypothetical protein